MAGRRNHYAGRRSHHNTMRKDQEVQIAVLDDNSILSQFQQAAIFLTDRQDRHERLVRLSRDVTIESKRIIFLLHSAIVKGKTKDDIIDEAKNRFDKLINGPIKALALEMDKVSLYLHHKAISPGMQEFVEAQTLLSFMEHKDIISLTQLRNKLTFTVESEDGSTRSVSALLDPLDYLLGLSDLTGELMRKAISGISSHDIDGSILARNLIRQIYTGCLGLSDVSHYLLMKQKTTRANLNKVEGALSAYNMRRSEIIPKLANTLLLPPEPAIFFQDVKEEIEQLS